MVPRQYDRKRAGQVRRPRAARLSRLSPALRLHEHERRAALEILRRPLSSSRRRRHREGGRDPRFLQGIFRDHGHERGLLSRDRRSGVPALPAAARADAIQRRADRPQGDQADVSFDGRRREGRHLRRRPDAGGAGSLLGLKALHENPSSAGGRRPLRRLQRQALGVAGLSCAQKSHPVEPVNSGRGRTTKSKSRATKSKLAATNSKPGATKSKLDATKTKFAFLLIISTFQSLNARLSTYSRPQAPRRASKEDPHPPRPAGGRWTMLRGRVGTKDYSFAPLTEPDMRASHPALWIAISELQHELG